MGSAQGWGEAGAALAAYDVGEVVQIEPAGGTAGRTWKVTTAAERLFLRRRGARTSTPERLSFDHALRRHLLASGVATAAARPTRAGQDWATGPEGTYELYPFIEGRVARPGSLADVAAAGRALARYHLAAGPMAGTGAPAPVAQYSSLGFSSRASHRMDDPELLIENLEATAGLAPGGAEAKVVRRCVERVAAMDALYAGAAYEALAGWVLHGDYTPANLVWALRRSLPTSDPYRGLDAEGDQQELVFVFDLDWAVPGARCRDVADGLYFFGTRPRGLDGSSIWSLTEAADFDRERCATFLGAYEAIGPLSAAERAAVPDAFAGRWLSIRLEGMAKVPEKDRFTFFCRGGDVGSPMAWLDANWPELATGLDPSGGPAAARPTPSS